MPIHSEILTNPKAERVRRLADLTRAKTREKTGRFLIEGPQAVREAVRWTPLAVTDLYVAADEEEDAFVISDATLEAIIETSQEEGRDIFVHLATREVMGRISGDCQGIVAAGDMAALADALPFDAASSRFAAAFWQVRDPGNAGAVIRAADAAGADAVIFVDECVDAHNPKVVRSTAGSLFHIPVAHMSAAEFLDWAGSNDRQLVAADVYGTEKRAPEPLPALLDDAGDGRPRVVLFGNEARGLESDLLSQADRIVAIPMYGKAESLNLATSAAVMLHSLAMRAHGSRAA